MLTLTITAISWDPDESAISSECEECRQRSIWEVLITPDQDIEGTTLRYCREHLALALPLAADLMRDELDEED